MDLPQRIQEFRDRVATLTAWWFRGGGAAASADPAGGMIVLAGCLKGFNNQSAARHFLFLRR